MAAGRDFDVFTKGSMLSSGSTHLPSENVKHAHAVQAKASIAIKLLGLAVQWWRCAVYAWFR
jgi:hypothetical protein